MRGRLCVAACVLSLLGCSGAPRTEPAAAGIPTAHVDGREVIVLQRPLEGHVALSVWMDAGSLDGASTALVAADLVVLRDDSIEALVVPDGTRFHTLCEVADLEACVQRVAAAVAMREPDEALLERARMRVAQRRDAAIGSPRREAEVLATSAALGIEVAPLGSVEDVVTRGDVRDFVADHYGVERSLWIAIGEVPSARVAAALASAARPSARRTRAERPNEREIDTPAAEHAGLGVWAIAHRARDGHEALAWAQAWRERAPTRDGVQVSAFPTRAGWIALASFPREGGDDDGRVAEWTHIVPWPAAASEADDDAWALADRLGQAWVARTPNVPSARTTLALVGEDAEAVLAHTMARATTTPARGETRGVVVDDAASLTIAWALPGPRADGASGLGASAIAAELLRRRCARDATIAAWPEAIVVSTSGPAEEAMAQSAAWSDCVAWTTPSTTEIEVVRRGLVTRAQADDTRRTIAARTLAPEHPGWVAIRPSRTALSDVAPHDVLARWRSWQRSGTWAFVGSAEALSRAQVVPSDRGTRTEAPSGAPSVRPTSAPSPLPARERVELDTAELLIATALRDCGEPALGDAWLALWTRSAHAAGATVAWREHGAARGITWAALSVRGEATVLSELAAHTPTQEAWRAARETARRDHSDVARLAAPRALAVEAALGARQRSCEGTPTSHRVWLDPHPSRR